MSSKNSVQTTSTASRRNRVAEFAAGTELFQEGQLGTEMYVIHRGEVEIYKADTPGNAVVILEKGDFFGEMALLEQIPRSASARARTDVTLLRVDLAMFTDLIRAEPEIAVRIMRKLGRRLRELERLVKMLSDEERDLVAERSARKDSTGPVPVEGAAEAILIHRGTGKVFPLSFARPVYVGRRDPITGIEPSVDLTELDTERSCSRQHAKIYREGEILFLIEEIETTNGTFVNEQRLDPGVSHELNPGDQVRFGLVSLHLAPPG